MRLHKVCIALALSILVVPIGFTQIANQDAPALNILLTNDDGYDAPGIQAMYRAFVAAGHRVTLVAPAEQQSGSSVRLTRRESNITLKQEENGIWAVGGSPADAVLVGFYHVLSDSPPDLVVSGSNFGENIGPIVNSSGTVGAAIMAMQCGVPAIAVSVETLLDEGDAQPSPYPSTIAAFEPAAAFTAELVRQLQLTGRTGIALLPAYSILNVNYPALRVDQIKGVQFTQVGRGILRVIYHETDVPGELTRENIFQPVDGPVETTDTIFLGRGYITISVLDGDWTADAAVRTSLSSRLAGLKIQTSP